MGKNIFIGCSGWSYEKDWVGTFYKSKRSMLSQYQEIFDITEINSTFYKYPDENLIGYLAKKTKPGFMMTAKFPRIITHDKRLGKVARIDEDVSYFLKIMRPLNDVRKLKALLIQLPPYDVNSLGNLESFLASLSDEFRYAIEFRHKSWFTKQNFDLLEKYNVAFTVTDSPLLNQPVIWITTDFSYVRWHGHGKDIWYDYLYKYRELIDWAPIINKIAKETNAVYAFFNNHFRGNAPLNALEMLEILGIINPIQKKKLIEMKSSVNLSLTEFIE